MNTAEKKPYEPAEFEIILLENDVITTSSGGPEPFPGEDEDL